MTVSTYDRDFHAWSQEPADLLRAQRFAEIDLDHLIEDLDAMGARERRELISRLKVLLAQLLKWQFQPQMRSRSWEATIKEQRLSLQDLVDENPGFEALLEQQAIPKAYRLARLFAVKETNLEESTFPRDCPYALTETRDPDYYPQ
ncbi:DUF29 domain-containing protein [Lamprocystis purpurea]|uniref:DUF29 domain-containing protein n=1 Tax=Lamprocystis purpurea TaxID=61598 RepID=UPI00037B0649|nr:DUF29 domain-containing protein [Lamprocystis purpurea]